MPNYRYKAQDEKGKAVTGTLHAASEEELHQKLKDMKQFLISAKEVEKVKNNRELKAKTLAEFSRELGKLTGAGVPLVRALNIVAKEEGLPAKEKQIYEQVLKMVCQGIPLSDAMEEQNGAFPSLFINMIRSAEVSGNLDRTTLRMADHYEKESRLHSKLRSATTYPKILLVLLVIVISIIMGYVVPKFGKVFDQLDNLPTPTKILLSMSDFISHNWLLLLGILLVLILCWNLIAKIPAVRYQKDKFKLHMPILGRQYKIIYTARFARTLSSLYSSGISIVTALEIARHTIGNTYIEAQFDKMIGRVRSGDNLSDALTDVDGFVQKLQASVRVGEETGSLDSMLDSIADTLDYDSEMAIGRMISYLEPLMIIIMGIVIGIIVIAVIMPIYDSYSAIGGGNY